MSTSDPRRLLARIRGLVDENADLRERLAHAYREIERLRPQVIEQTAVLRTAAPRELESAGLVPVTAAELQEVGIRLHELLGQVG